MNFEQLYRQLPDQIFIFCEALGIVFDEIHTPEQTGDAYHLVPVSSEFDIIKVKPETELENCYFDDDSFIFTVEDGIFGTHLEFFLQVRTKPPITYKLTNES